MPILDYKKKAETSAKHFYEREDISEANKKYVKKFLDGYNRSHARIDIFLTHIHHLLNRTNDIKKDMLNRDKINILFKEIRKESPKNYYTIVNIANVFVRWLNDGDKPNGFKDIKSLKKDKQKRDLNPSDMITWEDGLKLISATNSIQFKAIIALQLDGGFRPSEFIDLNYGDIQIKKEFIIAHVRKGKTGPRYVILWRAVPHLLRWLQSHPTKNKNDPLWIKENSRKGKYDRYGYPAILKRIKGLGQSLKFEKPLDFYSFRHSACYLSKMDNVPEEIAAEKFGHSIQYYTNTYARLSSDDKIIRLSKHYGIEHEDSIAIKKNKLCVKCEFSNVPEAEYCDRCGASLSLNNILEVAKEKEQLQNQLVSMRNEFEEYKAELRKYLHVDIKKQIARQISFNQTG